MENATAAIEDGISLLRQGKRYWAFYKDNQQWVLLGMHEPSQAFSPLGIGLTAAQDTGGQRIPAIFERFTLQRAKP